MGRYAKPTQAAGTLNYGEPITRRLAFAVASGWDRGQGQPFTTVTREVLGTSGAANGTLPAGGPAMTKDFGWGHCSSNDGWYNYSSMLTPPTFDPSAGFSFACVVQPLVLPAVNTFNRRVLQKRASGAATDPGFDAFLDSFVSLTWSFEWSNGVIEQTLRSTVVPVLNRSDLLVGTLEPLGSIARLYVNGALDVSAALAVVPVNPLALPIGVCGGIGPVGDRGGDNCVGFAAIWNRALSAREVTELWASPYRMFI